MSDQNQPRTGSTPADSDEQKQQSGNFLANTAKGGLGAVGGIFGAGAGAANSLSQTAGNLVGDASSQVTGGKDNFVSDMARTGGNGVGGVFAGIGGAVKNVTGAPKQQDGSQPPTNQKSDQQ